MLKAFLWQLISQEAVGQIPGLAIWTPAEDDVANLSTPNRFYDSNRIAERGLSMPAFVLIQTIW